MGRGSVYQRLGSHSLGLTYDWSDDGHSVSIACGGRTDTVTLDIGDDGRTRVHLPRTADEAE